ncbi:MAG: prepilin-type N-terminal cleavage/methylation domain-containing protein [Rubrivivax sp.]|nr:prepilin-type N-terminal cleavage/methylation domain-containing protein [Rubrivivax sp.]
MTRNASLGHPATRRPRRVHGLQRRGTGRGTRRGTRRGFTLLELVVALALVGVLALVALPLAEVTSTRVKEAELKRSLRVIRGALDQYKAAVDAGQLPRAASESGYPPTLEVLTRPLAVQGAAEGEPGVLVLLRQLPRDPFATDRRLAAAATWRTRAYGSAGDAWDAGGRDVFDVASSSNAVALDGSRYEQW